MVLIFFYRQNWRKYGYFNFIQFSRTRFYRWNFEMLLKFQYKCQNWFIWLSYNWKKGISFFSIFKIDENTAISILFSFRALDFTDEILKNCSNSNISAKIGLYDRLIIGKKVLNFFLSSQLTKIGLFQFHSIFAH